jgi:TonB family protein
MRVPVFFLMVSVWVAIVTGQTPVSTPDKGFSPTVLNGAGAPPRGPVVNGKAVSLPKPHYPRAARIANISGNVVVQLTIDEQGNVISATAKSGPCLLIAAAEAAAMLAKFTPTTLGGHPVKVTGVITYNFAPADAGRKSGLPTSINLELVSLGAMLTLSRDTNADPAWESTKRKAIRDLPLSDDEAKAFDMLSIETEGSKRAQAIDEVLALSRKKMTGIAAWKFELGVTLGEILSETEKGSGNERIDEQPVRDRLSRIKRMLSTVPDDFPPEVLARLNWLTSFSEKDGLNSAATRPMFIRAIVQTFEEISPSP